MAQVPAPAFDRPRQNRFRPMTLPTEPIGSIPRPQRSSKGWRPRRPGNCRRRSSRRSSTTPSATRSGVSRRPAPRSSPTASSESRASRPTRSTASRTSRPAASTIPFRDGHTRQLPVLTAGPFRYATYAATYLDAAKKHAHVPLKQAVISASALSLLYPQGGIPDYPRRGLPRGSRRRGREADIRQCLDRGAPVQIDFTEGRLAVKLDPSKGLLNSFVDLNNRVLDRFTPAERKRIGVHTCPGGDRDSTHSADVDYARAAPGALPTERRELLRPAREREGPTARARASSESTRPATAGSSSA